MTTIEIAATYPGTSSPIAFGTVAVRLVDAGSGGATGEQVITGTQRVQLDADGEGSIALVPNASIDPPGTHYAFTVDGASPATVRTITVPTSATPLSWADPTIQVVTSVPPVRIPAAASGTSGQVVAVNQTEDDYELVDVVATDADLSITSGSAPAFRNATTQATLEAGLLALGVAAGTAAVAGATVEGYVVTDAGADQEGINDNAARLAGWSLGTSLVAAQNAEASAAAAEAFARDLDDSEMEARTSTDPIMELCNDFGGDHDSAAYLTPPPGDFTTGACWRFKVTPLPFSAPAPSDGDTSFSEWSTQTADGVGIWDNFELAGMWQYDGAAGLWRLVIFLEWTEIGGTVEAHSLNTGVTVTTDGVTYYHEIPVNATSEYAVHLDFANGDGDWEVNVWRRTTHGTPDDTFGGAEWLRVYRTIGVGATSIDTGVTEDWGIGQGQGKVRMESMEVRDVGPAGTILANPTSALAAAAGEGVAFDDAQSNTWTPGADAAIVTPNTSAATTDASLLTSGTLAFARLPIGTTSTTVPAGNDSRITGAVQSTLADAKGDMLVASGADAMARLAVGADGATPHADANSSTGILWARAARTHLFATGSYTPLAPPSTSVGQTLQRLFYVPFYVPARRAFDRIGVNHTATTTTTGGYRLGIYATATSGGVPGALVIDAGIADLTTAAAAKEITISTTLDPGLYWACSVAQLTGSTPAVTSSGVCPIQVPLTAIGASSGTYLYEAGIAGALPATAAPTAATSQAPLIWLRGA